MQVITDKNKNMITGNPLKWCYTFSAMQSAIFRTYTRIPYLHILENQRKSKVRKYFILQ